MSIESWIDQIRRHPDSRKIGMIATHLGVVRGTSRDSGAPVSQVQVEYDTGKLDAIKTEMRQRPGIVDVVVVTNEGVLDVGDMVMFVAVGGDYRENVFPTLFDTVDRIKKEASRKKEFPA